VERGAVGDRDGGAREVKRHDRRAEGEARGEDDGYLVVLERVQVDDVPLGKELRDAGLVDPEVRARVVGGLGAGVSRAGATSVAWRDVVCSAGPPQGRVIMRITISRAIALNAPSASGRRDLFGAIGVTSCRFAAGDDSRGGAARGAGASSQAATCGGDGGNSIGRPRAAQKS